MKKIKGYNQFLNEAMINEFVDPITLAFAIAGIGIAFGPQIKNAYMNRKISKANLKELEKLKKKAEAKVKKLERQGLDHHAAEAQEKVDQIQAQIESLIDKQETENKIISDFEKNSRTRKDLEQELATMDSDELAKILRAAKKEAKRSV
jgi:hypothetical protein